MTTGLFSLILTGKGTGNLPEAASLGGGLFIIVGYLQNRRLTNPTDCVTRYQLYNL